MSGPLDGRPILVAEELRARVREAGFALLLTGRRPVTQEEIGHTAGVDPGSVGPLLDDLADAGWIDRDTTGRVTGSGGLSLTDGPHRLEIEGAVFQNWCAYDSLGIAAALGADAVVETDCAVCGRSIRVQTSAGEPPAASPERLWLADGGSDLRGDFCAPTVLLCSADHAAVWAERQAGRGHAVDLAEASRLGRDAWAGCAQAVAKVRGRAR